MGSSVSDVIDAHGAGRRHLQELRPDCPDAFAEIVDCALQLDPSARFQSAAEAQRALAVVLSPLPAAPSVAAGPVHRQRARAAPLVAVVGALALAGVGVARMFSHPAAGGAPHGSVAVIPFRTTGDALETQQLVEAMSDDITVQLSRLPGLRLVAGTSASRYRNSSEPVTQIGRDLNVEALVTGRVQMRESAVRVTVELVDTTSSQQLWADTFVGRTDEFDALQSRIAVGIASALKGQLTQDAARAIARKPMHSDALRLYLRGRYLANKRTPEDRRAALNFFQQALTTARCRFAHADSRMHVQRTVWTAAAGARPRTIEGRRAESGGIRRHTAAAHGLGAAYQQEWRFAESAVAYRRALALSPNYAVARHWDALCLVEKAFRRARREIDYAFSSIHFQMPSRQRGVVPTSPATTTARSVDFRKCSLRTLDLRRRPARRGPNHVGPV